MSSPLLALTRFCGALLLTGATYAAPTFTNPVLDANFPDPFILKDGGRYYAYATNGSKGNVPYAVSRDLVSWETRGDALPRLPAWAQWAGIALLIAAVVASGIWSGTEHWRRATFSLGVAVMWLGALRLTCDSKILGVFAVRSVKFDVAFCLVTGGLMTFLAASVDSLGS